MLSLLDVMEKIRPGVEESLALPASGARILLVGKFMQRVNEAFLEPTSGMALFASIRTVTVPPNVPMG